MKNNIFLKSIAILIVCNMLFISCMDCRCTPPPPPPPSYEIAYRFINNTPYAIESVLFGEIAPSDTTYIRKRINLYINESKENELDPNDTKFALWNWKLYSDNYNDFSKQSPVLTVCYKTQNSMCNTYNYKENPSEYEGILKHSNYTFEKEYYGELQYYYQFTYVFTEEDYLKATETKRIEEQRVIKNQTNQVVKFYNLYSNKISDFDNMYILHILNPKDSLVESMAKIYNVNTIGEVDLFSYSEYRTATFYAPTILNLDYDILIIRNGDDKCIKLEHYHYLNGEFLNAGLLNISNYEYKKIDDYHYNYVYEITEDYFKDAENCN